MSFFGQQNNQQQQQQSSGFGGFGASNNSTSTGFGQPATNTGSSLFGNTNTSTTANTGFGGFGSGGNSGFGSNTTNTTPFGQNRPAFGAPTTSSGGGLFGSGTATTGNTGFGGFGGTNNANNNNNSTSGGGLFGAAKPAFGNSNTGGGLFGGTSTGSGFGQANNQAPNAFGTSSALGQNVGECQGTGSTPFSAFTEKEGTGNQTNHFQSISFMAPYKNFSFEELRLADYNQGRRFGNASGQAGAFGSTNFSGFGQQSTTGGFGQTNNSGGLYGQTNTTSSPFGAGQTAQSGFGTNTGGSLFGGAKPATGGIFGQPSTSTAQQGGGLFGSAGATNTGFGSGNTGGGFGTSGGLFGNNNNNQTQQAKPSAFGTNTGTTGTGGFGSSTGFGNNNNNAGTSGGLFGQTNQNNTTSAFGQQPNNQSGGLFGGGFGNQNQNQNQSGNSTGFGFGQQNQEQKPGGLFGNSNTAGGGLFGNANQNNQQAAGSSLFGNQNNQAPGNSLFGNKPATTGPGLFGNTNTNNNAGNSGGLFGSSFGNNNANQPQQNQSGGLFGNTNNQQKPGGLFGNPSSNSGGLFGNTNNQQSTGGGLFGNSNQQQQQPTNSLFGNNNNNQGSSLFGNSQQPQPQQQNAFQSPQTFQTSILDPNAFGSPSIFGGLPPPPQVSGPIATPISSKKNVKKSVVIPHYKFNPNNSSRFQTPQRRGGGFGFSYSTYGTPGSVSSNASTPGGFSSSTLYNSIGRGLGKSLSTSNLRRNFEEAESVLTPGAFSAGSSRYGGSNNLKRLTIDRSLRTDLFSGGKEAPQALPNPEKEKQPSILKKKVSFDASTVGGNGEQQATAQNDTSMGSSFTEPIAEEQGFLRSPRTATKPKTNGAPPQPEPEQVRGHELAIVHEDASPVVPDPPANEKKVTPVIRSQEDPSPGDYWMQPSKAELSKLSKDALRKVVGFAVGRDGCGHVEFDRPVDLTLTKTLDDIFGNVVLVELRSITVYPDQAKKPAQGKGLNVPSTLYLENSWPRQKDKKTPLHEKSGPRYNKHVDRLRKVNGTEFVRYEKETGTWVFKVPHFTTYGFDYEDDASMASEAGDLNSSVLSEVPDTPTPKSRAPKGNKVPTNETPKSSVSNGPEESFAESTNVSYASSSPEDTFQFRKKKYLPGAFDESELPDDEQDGFSEDDHEMQEIGSNGQSFLGERLDSPSVSGEDEPSDPEIAVNEAHEQSVVVREEDEEMDPEITGAFPSNELKSMSAMIENLGTPAKGAFNMSGDWADALQRTLSPKKQDRIALREQQVQLVGGQPLFGETSTTKKASTKSIKTHGDLMNSLFGKEQLKKSKRESQKAAGSSKASKWPSSRKSQTDDNMPEQLRLLHDNLKPRWGPTSILAYSIPREDGKSRAGQVKHDDVLQRANADVVSEGRVVSFAKFGVITDLLTPSLQLQRSKTKIRHQKGVPMAHTMETPFAHLAASVQPGSAYEKNIWTLASILFDDQDLSTLNLPTTEHGKYDNLARKERLISFWSRLCQPASAKSLEKTSDHQERAIHHLSHHDIAAACADLIQVKDFRLSTLVAQIGDGDQTVRDDMAGQIDAWRDLNVLSEMSEPIRALYALLAGKTCVCEGKKGPLEDRARDFGISQRFKLDWKRAFGLRLYYATLAADPIEAAIKSFAKDLQDGSELAKPTRTVIGPDGNEMSVDGDDEDILWSMLKLYAASKDWLPLPSIAQMLNQQDRTADNKMNVVLSFQLYHALTIRFPQISNAAAADALAVDFAAQLDAVGEWIWAVFAVCHITSAPHRQQRLQDLLAQHALDIPTSDPQDEKFVALTHELHIPATWIWQAKALAARVITADHIAEVDCLVHAGDWSEAHNVLRRTVAPKCIIGEDWPLLGSLLEKFTEGKENIEDWAVGGQVYEDFLTIIIGGGRGAKGTYHHGHGGSNEDRMDEDDNITEPQPTTNAADAQEEEEEALDRLLDILPSLVEKADTRRRLHHRRTGVLHPRVRNNSISSATATMGDDGRESRASREGLEEMVALKEISRVVGKRVLASPPDSAGKVGGGLGGDGAAGANTGSGAGGIWRRGLTGQEARVLQLPLARDVRREFGRDVAGRYYWDLMAGTGTTAGTAK